MNRKWTPLVSAPSSSYSHGPQDEKAHGDSAQNQPSSTKTPCQTPGTEGPSTAPRAPATLKPDQHQPHDPDQAGPAGGLSLSQLIEPQPVPDHRPRRRGSNSCSYTVARVENSAAEHIEAGTMPPPRPRWAAGVRMSPSIFSRTVPPTGRRAGPRAPAGRTSRPGRRRNNDDNGPGEEHRHIYGITARANTVGRRSSWRTGPSRGRLVTDQYNLPRSRLDLRRPPSQPADSAQIPGSE